MFWEIVASLLFNIVGIFARGGPEAELSYLQLRQVLSWFSPNTLYTESAVALLTPEIRTLGPLLSVFLQAEAAGLIPRSQLPLSQSLLLAWPQLTGLVGTVIILFTYAYVRFQRQEVRA